MNDKIANPAPLGFFGLALAGWMVSMPYAGWFEPAQLGSGAAHAALAAGSFLLVLAAIFAFVRGEAFHAFLFAANGAFFWTFSKTLGMADPSDLGADAYWGWAALVWTVLFAYLWLGSFRKPPVVMLVTLGLAVTFLFHMLADFGAGALRPIAGYAGLITAILAIYESAGLVLGDAGWTLPGTRESGSQGGGSGL